MKPVIGITCGNAPGTSRRTVEAPAPIQYVQRPFIDCIEQSGGIPLLLPCLEDRDTNESLMEMIDGLLIPGGVDADPRFFGGVPHAKIGTVDPEKDLLEIALIDGCSAAGKPVLGLCRGIQMIAIAFGGEIYQDLASEKPGAFNHMQNSPMTFPSHDVQIETGTLLYELMGNQQVVPTNSSHHQAVNEIPEQFTISGRTSDGVIEGLEHEDGLLLGVQWHPERTYDRDPWSRPLFDWLISTAAG